MKNMYKLALLAAVGLVSITSAQAQYAQGDLLAGFTTGSGNDLIVDLGAASSLTQGETWNLASLLTGNLSNPAIDTWGVIGVSGSPSAPNYVAASSAVYITAQGANAAALSSIGSPQFKAARTDVATIGGNITSGTSAYDAASDGASWNTQTTGSTGIAADQTNPNTTGVTSENFYLVQNAGTTQDSFFSLGSNDTLTFGTVSAVPEPATYGLLSGAGMLLLGLRRQFSRKA
jgi:hypothetical protein